MKEEFFNKLREKIFPYFEGTNPCHDMDHIDRVLSLALTIGEKENADLEILKVAVLLHDIARKEQDEFKGEICHAERGCELAREILKELGYSGGKIEKVIHCIKTHRFKNGDVPKSIEAKILYDADKLDSIGGIGILRVASFSGYIGSVVHNPSVDIEKTKAYSKDDSAYREFLVKLVRVKDKMFTDEGKRIAKGRHKFMAEFFDRLNKEVKGEL
ncbi:HD domain-containing protein [Candidatus Pacearchaeota archaeon]|nr:HD domain-containing protein [Candidatus Pacearchaeota archaeon]